MKETDILTTPEQIRTWEEIQSRNHENKTIAFCFHDGTSVAKSTGSLVSNTQDCYQPSIEFSKSMFLAQNLGDAFIEARKVHPSIFAIIFHDFMSFTNWYNDVEHNHIPEYQNSYTVEEFIEAHQGTWYFPHQTNNRIGDLEQIDPNPEKWIGLRIYRGTKPAIITDVRKVLGKPENIWIIVITPKNIQDSIGGLPGIDIEVTVTASKE